MALLLTKRPLVDVCAITGTLVNAEPSSLISIQLGSGFGGRTDRVLPRVDQSGDDGIASLARHTKRAPATQIIDMEASETQRYAMISSVGEKTLEYL